MSIGELACSYAALILEDDNIEVTAGNISKILKAANISAEAYWPSLFAKLAEKRSIRDLIANVGAGGGGGGAVASSAPVSASAAVSSSAAEPAPAAKKEEPQEESDDDMGFSLFD